ncbi:3'-5' exoribonuclease, partial [Escherichia coli]|uniref:3'-5' exonuclease n=1 Tax=Escherichia coli TaxID=562 RepID=UPI001E31613B
MRYRARPDASTILWWLEQSEEARKSLTSNTQELSTALSWLSEFIIKNANHKFVQVWGNGASFDCVILRNSYSLTGQPVPWQWWNDRDVRTIVELGKVANLTAERDALREGEMGDARHSNTRAAADIYFQLVEECEIPAGGSLVEYVDDMREKLEAAEKR